MNGLRWMGSPLFGTAGVVAGLALLAIPLRQLTSARPVERTAIPEASAPSQESPAVMRLKLLDPVARLRIETLDGKPLFESPTAAAGETEHDIRLPLLQGSADLRVSMEAGDSETALFITLMPDGREDRTRFLTGSGPLEEVLHFEWGSH